MNRASNRISAALSLVVPLLLLGYIFRDWIGTDFAGNLGSFLNGLALLAIITQLYFYQEDSSNNAFKNRIQRTFEYIKTLHAFYYKFYFLNMENYVENVIEKKPIEELKARDNRLGGQHFEGMPAFETVRSDLFEFYVFLQEIREILQKNQQISLIDKQTLRRFIRSYTHQIKTFFTAAELMLKISKVSMPGLSNGWGTIDESDLHDLKIYFLNEFDFLK